ACSERTGRHDPSAAVGVQGHAWPDGHDLDAGHGRVGSLWPLTQCQIRDVVPRFGDPFGERSVPALSTTDSVRVEAVVDEADPHLPRGRFAEPHRDAGVVVKVALGTCSFPAETPYPSS